MTNATTPLLTVAGGVYFEHCMHPPVDTIYGSAGRAANAIAKMGARVALQSYMSDKTVAAFDSISAFGGFEVQRTTVDKSIHFAYDHGLAEPQIYGHHYQNDPLVVNGGMVVRFGMLEGTVVVDADYVVYDPQNVASPESFSANGSKAKHLALILNRYEAKSMAGAGDLSPEALALHLWQNQGAEVVVIKMGALGALVCDQGKISTVPAFETTHVSKIGSGDMFVAHFSYAWMCEKRAASDAALRASKATAYFCQCGVEPAASDLDDFQPTPIVPSQRYLDGYRPKVYLAGPFFSLAQIWLVTQARKNLVDMGMDVFSPYHDVGLGRPEDVVQEDLVALRESDVVFAIGDGLDSGTVYEVGYARARNTPVIFYSENESEEDKKMMEGSDCDLCKDYVTAIYRTLWKAIAL